MCAVAIDGQEAAANDARVAQESGGVGRPAGRRGRRRRVGRVPGQRRQRRQRELLRRLSLSLSLSLSLTHTDPLSLSRTARSLLLLITRLAWTPWRLNRFQRRYRISHHSIHSCTLVRVSYIATRSFVPCECAVSLLAPAYEYV